MRTRGTNQAIGEGLDIELLGKVRAATSHLARCSFYNPASTAAGIAKEGDWTTGAACWTALRRSDCR
jgi:hypothetical protein